MLRLIEKGKCSFCGKEREVLEFAVKGETKCFCFADLKKLLRAKILFAEEKKV